MSDFKIVDKDGVWVQNRCAMPMSNGVRNIKFMPGVPMKVTLGDWEKLQLASNVLVEVDDPLHVEEPVAKEAKEDVKSPEPKGKGKA